MSVIHLADGTVRRLGRKRPVAHGPRLKMARYMTSALPTPPASVDYAPKAAAALHRMYCNDSLGSCVASWLAHFIGITTGNADGAPFIFTDPQVVQLYSALSGYRPGHPETDVGCNEVDALNYMIAHGAPSGQHKIAGYLAVNPLDTNEVKTAIWLFEGLTFGIELPDEWTQVTGSGFVWDAGTPNSENGHCVGSPSFSAQGLGISTWGMLGTMTWAALARDVIAQSGGELYAVITHDMISRATGRAPNGFDFSQLVADFNAIGGHLPLPAPAPMPPPLPQNPTKAQVISALDASLGLLGSASWTKAHVVSTADAALSKLHWVK